MLLFYKGTDTIGRLVEERSHVDDAGFADQFPSRGLVGVLKAKWAGILESAARARDGVGRHIDLSAGVAVDLQ